MAAKKIKILAAIVIFEYLDIWIYLDTNNTFISNVYMFQTLITKPNVTSENTHNVPESCALYLINVPACSSIAV